MNYKNHLKFISYYLVILFLIISCTTRNKNTSNQKKLTNKKLNQSNIEQNLLKMNNSFIPSFTDTCYNKGSNNKTIKILILGNSIAIHSVSETIGWNQLSGMAASSLEKDYAHLLLKKIQTEMNFSKACLRISNFSGFERNPESLDINFVKKELITYEPDIIVFQLGENTSISSKQKITSFEKQLTQLIRLFKQNKKPLTICTTPFFPSKIKNEIISRTCLNTKSYLVDLSHLILIDSENYAKNEKNYAGNRSTWKEEGIGIHPGDFGMNNIANQIFLTINASLDKKKQ